MTRRIAIIGTGGHGREVADVLRHQVRLGRPIELAGFIDEDRRMLGKVVDGLRVLGDFSWFKRPDRRRIAVVCAVGTPTVCRKLAAMAKALGLEFADAISPLGYVSPRAKLGAGAVVFPYAVVNGNAALGDQCTLNIGASVSHDCVVGDYCILNPGARLAGNVRLGKGCYVGMGATVIQGVTIGAGTVIGAGAAVIRDLPARVTAVGVPAVPI